MCLAGVDQNLQAMAQILMSGGHTKPSWEKVDMEKRMAELGLRGLVPVQASSCEHALSDLALVGAAVPGLAGP